MRTLPSVLGVIQEQSRWLDAFRPDGGLDVMLHPGNGNMQDCKITGCQVKSVATHCWAGCGCVCGKVCHARDEGVDLIGRACTHQPGVEGWVEGNRRLAQKRQQFVQLLAPERSGANFFPSRRLGAIAACCRTQYSTQPPATCHNFPKLPQTPYNKCR